MTVATAILYRDYSPEHAYIYSINHPQFEKEFEYGGAKFIKFKDSSFLVFGHDEVFEVDYIHFESI